jgi:hypothetical protein
MTMQTPALLEYLRGCRNAGLEVLFAARVLINVP